MGKRRLPSILAQQNGYQGAYLAIAGDVRSVVSEHGIDVGRCFRFPIRLSRSEKDQEKLEPSPHRSNCVTHRFLRRQASDRAGFTPSRLNLKQEIVRREKHDDAFRSDTRDVDDRPAEIVQLFNVERV